MGLYESGASFERHLVDQQRQMLQNPAASAIHLWLASRELSASSTPINSSHILIGNRKKLAVLPS